MIDHDKELNPEDRWRDAMRKLGRVGVQAVLDRRPGRPDDTVYDIVYTAPYPTRGFCQRWCAEQDNTVFRFSKRAALLTFVSCVLVAFVIRTILSFDALRPATPSMPYGGYRHSHYESPNAASSSVNDHSVANASIVRTVRVPSPKPTPLECAYISYPTSACPHAVGAGFSPSSRQDGSGGGSARGMSGGLSGGS